MHALLAPEGIIFQCFFNLVRCIPVFLRRLFVSLELRSQCPSCFSLCLPSSSLWSSEVKTHSCSSVTATCGLASCGSEKDRRRCEKGSTWTRDEAGRQRVPRCSGPQSYCTLLAYTNPRTATRSRICRWSPTWATADCKEQIIDKWWRKVPLSISLLSFRLYISPSCCCFCLLSSSESSAWTGGGWRGCRSGEGWWGSRRGSCTSWESASPCSFAGVSTPSPIGSSCTYMLSHSTCAATHVKSQMRTPYSSSSHWWRRRDGDRKSVYGYCSFYGS